MAKKKAAKKKAAARKKPAVKKKAAVKAIDRYTADLASVRAAIDRVVAHIQAGQTYATKAGPGAAPLARADKMLKSLADARQSVANECCQADQNCNFD